MYSADPDLRARTDVYSELSPQQLLWPCSRRRTLARGTGLTPKHWAHGALGTKCGRVHLYRSLAAAVPGRRTTCGDRSGHHSWTLTQQSHGRGGHGRGHGHAHDQVQTQLQESGRNIHPTATAPRLPRLAGGHLHALACRRAHRSCCPIPDLHVQRNKCPHHPSRRGRCTGCLNRETQAWLIPRCARNTLAWCLETIAKHLQRWVGLAVVCAHRNARPMPAWRPNCLLWGDAIDDVLFLNLAQELGVMGTRGGEMRATTTLVTIVIKEGAASKTRRTRFEKARVGLRGILGRSNKLHVLRTSCVRSIG